MQGKRTKQGFMAHILASQQETLDGRPKRWKVSSQAGPHFNRPIGGLVPRKEIPGVVAEEDEAHEDKPINPIQPATLVASGEKHSGQVENTGNKKNICRQEMKVPEQPAVSKSCHDMKDSIIGGILVRHILKKKGEAGSAKNHQARQANDPQSKRGQRVKGSPAYHRRMKMAEEVGPFHHQTKPSFVLGWSPIFLAIWAGSILSPNAPKGGPPGSKPHAREEGRLPARNKSAPEVRIRCRGRGRRTRDR